MESIKLNRYHDREREQKIVAYTFRQYFYENEKHIV